MSDDEVAQHNGENKMSNANKFKYGTPADEFTSNVIKFPGDALMFAVDKLTIEQFNYCVENAPDAALEYTAKKLTREELNALLEKNVAVGEYVRYRLTNAQFNECVKNAPAAALEHVKHKLTNEQIDYCTRHAARYIWKLQKNIARR
jgi:hypothetical protein